MKRYDLICVGHMGVDLYFRADNLTFAKDRFQLALGGKYFSDHFQIGVGGGGANVAIGAKKCGLRVGLIAKYGNNPFKKIISERFRQVGVATDMCIYEKGYLNISIIFTRGAGERTIINHERHHTSLVKKPSFMKQFLRGRALFMANLLDIHIKERIRIFSYVKKHNVRTILNMGAKDCRRPLRELKPLLQNADILIFNTHEFSDLVKKAREKINFKENVVKEFPLLKGKIVIVTDGKLGSYGYTDKEKFYVKAYEPKKIIDTTGAGDAYTAGFLASYLKSHNVYLAMRRGSYYAGRKLAHFGAN